MRRTLVVVVAVILAGCTVGGPGATPDSAAPDTPASPDRPSASESLENPSPESPTPAPGECVPPRTTDDGNAKLTPKPRPERPESFSNETAADYAASFEEAYAWNGALSDGIQSATVSITVTNVTRVADGYVVTLDVHAGYTENVTVDDGTPIQQAADDWYTAAYFLDGSVLRRSVARTASATLDPRNGTAVACYGG